MLARGAKSLRASSLRPAGLRLASGVPARTPEQTEHLEKLAEEHNGFLFGEVVRAARASPDIRASLVAVPPGRRCVCSG